jgi:proliferating cell nuclear antigen
MFEVKMENATVFKNCVDALVTLIDEGEFDLTKEGMTLRAMDPSKIAMVDLVIPKSAFEKYEVSADRKLGLNLDDLSKIVTRSRPGETLTLRPDKTKSRLELVFKGKSTRRFSLPLLDIGQQTPKEPKIDFDSKIRINGSILKESLKDAALVSSHVVIKTHPEGFEISSRGDKGEVLIESKKNEDSLVEHTVNRDSKVMFPLEYLNDLLKATDFDTVITLDMKSDAPLKLQYPIGDATVTYYLAPRIESD